MKNRAEQSSWNAVITQVGSWVTRVHSTSLAKHHSSDILVAWEWFYCSLIVTIHGKTYFNSELSHSNFYLIIRIWILIFSLYFTSFSFFSLFSWSFSITQLFLSSLLLAWSFLIIWLHIFFDSISFSNSILLNWSFCWSLTYHSLQVLPSSIFPLLLDYSQNPLIASCFLDILYNFFFL